MRNSVRSIIWINLNTEDIKARIVRGIFDTYVVKEAVDSANNEKFLEVFEHVEDGIDDFAGDWLCDIDGTMNDTDEYILGEIDAALQ